MFIVYRPIYCNFICTSFDLLTNCSYRKYQRGKHLLDAVVVVIVVIARFEFCWWSFLHCINIFHFLHSTYNKKSELSSTRKKCLSASGKVNIIRNHEKSSNTFGPLYKIVHSFHSLWSNISHSSHSIRLKGTLTCPRQRVQKTHCSTLF